MLTSNFVAKAVDIIQPCSPGFDFTTMSEGSSISLGTENTTLSGSEITPMCGGSLNAITIPVGNMNVTTTLTHYISKGVYYFKITAPSAGYYDLDIDKLSYGTDFSVYILNSSLNTVTGSTGGSMIFNNLYLSKYSSYYVKIENNHQFSSNYYGNIKFKLTRYDDNISDKPKTLNTTFSSRIDYTGDADYYTFTNMGGVYDIYSTGYDSGNLDTKVYLYKCNSTSCSSKTLITSNDDHSYVTTGDYIEKIPQIYQGMGRYDFGIRVDLGAKDYQKYIIKVIHYSNSSTGNYTINKSHIGHKAIQLYNSDNSPIEMGVKWSFNYEQSYLDNSICKKVDVGTGIVDYCTIFEQYFITSQDVMDEIYVELAKIDGLLDDNTLFSMGTDGVVFSIPKIFKYVVEKYALEQTTLVSALKGVAAILVIADIKDSYNAAIASEEISTFRELLYQIKGDNEVLVLTNWSYDLDDNVSDASDHNVYLSVPQENITEVSEIFVDYNNTDVHQQENDILIGDLEYINDSQQIYDLINRYYEQYYAIIPW